MAVPVFNWQRHFRLLLWNCWTEFIETWQEARSQCTLPSLRFAGPIGKTRLPPRPLICLDIFDFSSETAERNSTKLDRKQDLNVLYQVCIFRVHRKNKMLILPIRQKSGTLYSGVHDMWPFGPLVSFGTHAKFFAVLQKSICHWAESDVPLISGLPVICICYTDWRLSVFTRRQWYLKL